MTSGADAGTGRGSRERRKNNAPCITGNGRREDNGELTLTELDFP